MHAVELKEHLRIANSPRFFQIFPEQKTTVCLAVGGASLRITWWLNRHILLSCADAQAAPISHCFVSGTRWRMHACELGEAMPLKPIAAAFRRVIWVCTDCRSHSQIFSDIFRDFPGEAPFQSGRAPAFCFPELLCWRFENLWKWFSDIFREFQRVSDIFRDFQIFSKSFRDVQRVSDIFKDFQRLSGFAANDFQSFSGLRLWACPEGVWLSFLSTALLTLEALFVKLLTHWAEREPVSARSWSKFCFACISKHASKPQFTLFRERASTQRRLWVVALPLIKACLAAIPSERQFFFTFENRVNDTTF